MFCKAEHIIFPFSQPTRWFWHPRKSGILYSISFRYSSNWTLSLSFSLLITISLRNLFFFSFSLSVCLPLSLSLFISLFLLLSPFISRSVCVLSFLCKLDSFSLSHTHYLSNINSLFSFLFFSSKKRFFFLFLLFLLLFATWLLRSSILLPLWHNG